MLHPRPLAWATWGAANMQMGMVVPAEAAACVEGGEQAGRQAGWEARKQPPFEGGSASRSWQRCAGARQSSTSSWTHVCHSGSEAARAGLSLSGSGGEGLWSLGSGWDGVGGQSGGGGKCWGGRGSSCQLLLCACPPSHPPRPPAYTHLGSLVAALLACVGQGLSGGRRLSLGSATTSSAVEWWWLLGWVIVRIGGAGRCFGQAGPLVTHASPPSGYSMHVLTRLRRKHWQWRWRRSASCCRCPAGRW